MKKHLLTGIAVGAVVALGLTACSSSAGAASATTSNGDKKDVTIAVFNGWPEGEAVSYLWQQVLEKKGYDVTLKYADAGPVFAGLSTNAYDVMFDGWLPKTHAAYMKQYGDKLVDLGAWNNQASLTIAVNKDAPIDSLDQLAANAGKFDNKIIGIEPGAGETGIVESKVIPGYGLDKMTFVTSSTPAMLAALKKATESGQNIAVTLWRPHWAYNAFPIKDLKDPKGLLGKAESMHSISSTQFTKNFPALEGWIKKFKLSSDLLYPLENSLFNSGAKQSEYPAIVKKWMSKNKSYVAGLTS